MNSNIFETILGKDNIKFNKEELQEKFNNCSTIHSSIEFVEGLGDQGSASITDKYIIKIKQTELNHVLGQENDFFMKIFLPVLDSQENEGLLINEINVYRKTNILLARGYTRNLIPLIAYSVNCSFDDICLLLSNRVKCAPNMRRQLLENISVMYCKYFSVKKEKRPIMLSNKGYKTTKQTENFFELCAQKTGTSKEEFLKKLYNIRLGFIMTKKANGSGSFHNFLREALYVKKDIDLILQHIFQILYTLYVFSKTGITHNDLHFGNIIMDKLWPSELKKSIYILPSGKSVLIDTKEVPRIFDFDRATTRENPNKMSKGYNYLGQSENFSTYRDTLGFICRLINYFSYIQTYSQQEKNKGIVSTKVLDIIKELSFLTDLVTKEGSKIDFDDTKRCHFSGPDGGSYLLDDKWMSQNMKTPEQILELLAERLTQKPITEFVSQIVTKKSITENEICILVKNIYDTYRGDKINFLSELLVTEGFELQK